MITRPERLVSTTKALKKNEQHTHDCFDVCIHISTACPSFQGLFIQSIFVFPYLGLATGDGEKIMRYCPSFFIVQLMSQGISPQQACETAVLRMKERHGGWFEVGVIALNNQVTTTRT